MSSTTIDAVYEGGVFRPDAPPAVAEGTRVRLVVLTAEPDESPLEGSPDEVAAWLAEIAAMPMESAGREDVERFSGRDHDRILYGEGRAR